MTDNTINNDMTMGGGETGTLLDGRYRVVRQLGRGGMGPDWLAMNVIVAFFVCLLPLVAMADLLPPPLPWEMLKS